MSDCLFCNIAAGDVPAKKVYEDEQLIAFNDINPQAPVHILIVPKKHIPTPYDITEADMELIGAVYMTAKVLAKEREIVESGFRVVVNCNEGAGQSVFHLHFHLLGGRPFRWPPG